MKRFMIFLLVLVQGVLYASAAPSPASASAQAYGFMRTTYGNAYQHQKLVEFYAAATNQARSKVESKCADTPKGEDCEVSSVVTITVTKQMAEASEIFYGKGEGLDENETIAMPAGTLTYRALEDSKLTHSVSIDISKIEEDSNEIIVFSWNDDGDVLRVYYADKDENYANTIVMLERNNTKKMIFNGYFDTDNDNREATTREAGVYVMEIQEKKDSTTNGIIERLSYKDIAKPTVGEVLSQGWIDNNGGYVSIYPFTTGIGFDSNGMPATVSSDIPADNTNGAMLKMPDAGGLELDARVLAATPSRFAIVKKGKTVGKYTILGYIAKAYGSGYEYEYFGLDSLLAAKGAISDSDQLDIYALDDKNKPTGEPVTNMWLTKK